MAAASSTDGAGARAAHGPRRLFLVGPMAAGKSTVGRQLAGALGLSFVDSDRELERRCGVDIPTIFDFEGESGFRERERRLLEGLTARDGLVLATGGGAVLDPGTRELLKERGTVIYLAVAVGEQLRRTRNDRSRPLLQVADRRATLERLQRERDPLYREVADIVIDTDRRPRKEAVKRILERLDTGG